ncbi:MAG: AlpA family phage regulatory protein [Pseudomonadota bacterium]
MSSRMIRLPEVLQTTGLSRSAFYRHVKAGIFSPSTKIGPNTVAWSEEDIERGKAKLIATFN